ncbi:Threonylcarbamoyl-AMP synthase [Porphyridium purpureum]|uniref:Threonylcarbamoyl-AMP synthase n=1 Tax=Porphyridium purpureum TaxID=35688 RepID=A0A5J4YJJ8_PORPP|nr:Threonylcarbamoyl-AMP synthase [Porphyridium purpureum]|eukprot:POR2824..scf246_12
MESRIKIDRGAVPSVNYWQTFNAWLVGTRTEICFVIPVRTRRASSVDADSTASSRCMFPSATSIRVARAGTGRLFQILRSGRLHSVVSRCARATSEAHDQKMERLDARKEQDIERAASLLAAGCLVAFPTETVYGLGADAFNDAAARSIFAAKGRPSDNPLIVHVDSIESLLRSGLVATPLPEIARKLAAAFWPGPLTLVLPKRRRTDNGAGEAPNAPSLSDTVTAGLDTVAVRVPSNAVAQQLLRRLGPEHPVAAPSANLSGRPSPTRAAHVVRDFANAQPCLVRAVLDGDASDDAGHVMCDVGLESTVVDVSCCIDAHGKRTGTPPCILRPGGITRQMLESAAGEAFTEHARDASQSHTGTDANDKMEAPKAPGMKYRHYAPSMPVILSGTNLAALRSALFERIRMHQSQQQTPCSIGVLAYQELCEQLESELKMPEQRQGDEANPHAVDVAVRFVPCGTLRAGVESFGRELYFCLRAFDEPQVNSDQQAPHGAACEESRVVVILAQSVDDTQGIGSAIMNRLRKAAGAAVDVQPA